MKDALPLKSNEKYEDARKDFCKFVKLGSLEPSEENSLQYFDYLKNNKKYASTPSPCLVPKSSV